MIIYLIKSFVERVGYFVVVGMFIGSITCWNHPKRLTQ